MGNQCCNGLIQIKSSNLQQTLSNQKQKRVNPPNLQNKPEKTVCNVSFDEDDLQQIQDELSQDYARSPKSDFSTAKFKIEMTPTYDQIVHSDIQADVTRSQQDYIIYSEVDFSPTDDVENQKSQELLKKKIPPHKQRFNHIPKKMFNQTTAYQIVEIKNSSSLLVFDKPLTPKDQRNFDAIKQIDETILRRLKMGKKYF